jgi:hypothetical protein
MLTVELIDPFQLLLETVKYVDQTLVGARMPYRIVGGMAVFLHMFGCDPESIRVTRGVDVAVSPDDLGKASALLQTRRYVNVLALRTDSSPSHHTADGIPIAPVADLVRIYLTSFRLKERLHVQDMDSVGLITPEIEASLSAALRERLAGFRATE